MSACFEVEYLASLSGYCFFSVFSSILKSPSATGIFSHGSTLHTVIKLSLNLIFDKLNRWSFCPLLAVTAFSPAQGSYSRLSHFAILIKLRTQKTGAIPFSCVQRQKQRQNPCCHPFLAILTSKSHIQAPSFTRKICSLIFLLLLLPSPGSEGCSSPAL